MRRVVVDPGVLVSALITPSGPPAQIVRAIREERLRIVVCPHLLAELLGVLQREKFRGYDYLLALARESSADALVSGDADLLVLEDTEHPVVNPTAFAEGLAAEPTQGASSE